jgi:glycosyltransferase involved in cell wall biosynthesis
MKVAFFTEGYDPFVNGVVTGTKTLRGALEEQGHEVVVFAPAWPGFRDSDQGVVRLPSVRWLKDAYSALSPLAWDLDVVEGEGFDLIHSHHPFTMSRLAERLARKHGLPLVYTFHTMLNEYGQYLPLFQEAGRRWLTRRFLAHCAQADWVTAATPAVRDFLRAEGMRTPSAVVPEGVPSLQAPPGAREQLRQELGVAEQTKLLLYVGRLAREKRLDLLLRSAALLGSGRDFRLCLVGGGAIEGSLRGLAERLGIADRVIFCGWVRHQEIARYYAAADLFVFPSPAEAMGIVLVEAMSLGLPCVAIDRYGPSDVVVDGVTGFLCPFDETDFAEAVRRLLDNPGLHSRMSQAARERARDFDPMLAARRLCAVYRAALGSRGLLAAVTSALHA